jgi:hypothetical protein
MYILHLAISATFLYSLSQCESPFKKDRMEIKIHALFMV